MFSINLSMEAVLIRRLHIGVVLCALAFAICIVPGSMGTIDQSQGTLTVQDNVSLNSIASCGNFAETSAVSYYYKKVITYKKVTYYKKVAYYKHHKKYYKYVRYYKYKKVVTYKKVYYKKVKAATKTTTTKTTTTTKSYGATYVGVGSTTVKATARCSCGAKGDYNYHTAAFKNYCPYCHQDGTLVWNPKATAEGEWTCSKCGADYCAVCGKEKKVTNPKYLTPA